MSRPAAARSLLDDCVHCGFCLPACPTYQSWAEEMDSPRGRIDLMRGLASGAVTLTPEVVRHFDRCLGCMGCVTACPSGVKYDVLIEETRARIEEGYRRPLLDRFHRALVFALFPYPRRLKALVGVLRIYVRSGLQGALRKSGLLGLLPARLAQLDALMPDVSRRPASALPRVVPASGERRYRVGLVAGCVQRVFFPEVNDATCRVLAAEGCEVVIPEDQGCCGALSIHAGRERESRAMGRALLETFPAGELDAILVNAAGCGSHLKDYGRLFASDPALAPRAAAFAAKVQDVNEFLGSIAPVATRHPVPLRVAYHDACHLAHAQRIREAPRRLLSSIPGLTLVEIPDGEQCCGSAGVYNLTEPESADEIGRRKVENVLSAEPELLASANPGCTLQIRKLLRERGAVLRAAHPIELLAASIEGRQI
ncbi:MAG TPA: (Fe-S)-binding protein [Thermoanaerobaculia bacterium]|nr:(Fe-S)-binding protein [Thermoanaerobaculia bacterium]